jgi:hypothetical protein
MHLVELMKAELEAFVQSGRSLHLAHAARALEELKRLAIRAPQEQLIAAHKAERER